MMQILQRTNQTIDLSRHVHLVVLLLALAAIGTIGVVIENHHHTLFLQRVSFDMYTDVLLRSKEFLEATSALHNDTLFLSKVPPMQGILRATRNHGLDALDNNSQAVWVERLQEIFAAFLNTHPEYVQLRYIGVANGGRELVRVKSIDGKAVVVPETELQAKGGRDYFLAGLKLANDKVYLSEFNLNREHGAIEKTISTNTAWGYHNQR